MREETLSDAGAESTALSTGEATAFGRSLHVDLYGVSPKVCDDLGFCYRLLDNLTTRLGMHKQSPPFIFHSPAEQFPDKAGLSGWVPLIESGISIHTLTVKGFVSIDIYTCGELHIDDAINFLKDKLGATSLEHQYLVRGTRYHAPTESSFQANSVYDRQWSSREYLRQYYSGPVLLRDEVANATFAARELSRLGRRYVNALEFGCGPTVHHAASLTPYVDHLDMTDYLGENLAEVRRWLDRDPEAHDWSACLSGVLACEETSERQSVEERSRDMRRVTRTLKRADIRRRDPLGDPALYDLVASYYCIDAVAQNPTEWAGYLAHLAALVQPGGVLLMGAMRRCNHYMVFDKRFPAAYLDETDFRTELPRLGFPPEMFRIDVAHDVGWAEKGFDSIVCVCAVKAN